MKKILQIPKIGLGILLVWLLSSTMLQAQTVLMTSPNGGERLLGASTHVITWTYTNVDNIAIEFSKDNGLTWTTLISGVPASSLRYNWTVPAVGSNLCKIRIKSLTQNSQDESNASFTIPEPTVALSYPIGGESFAAGTGQYIEWSATGVTTVMVQYSTNNAATWNDIGTFPAGNNYCNWVAPSTTGTQTKIRVYNIESPINQATSPTPFSTTTMPTSAPEKYFGGINDGYKMASSLSNTLGVLAPNGGESYYPNNTVDISWSFRNIDAVKIEYSTNNGSTWNLIAASVVADVQSYPWTIPNSPSAQCLIKVSDLGSDLSDVSNATFRINSASITLTYPNGGESFGEGTGQYIEWTSSSVATVLLEYSIDNGSTWTSIGTVAAANNYANWVAPAGAKSLCLIRVSDSATPAVSDTSNAVFATTTLAVADVAKYLGGANDGYSMANNTQPNITIASPNGGESWAAYSSHNISWSYTNVDNVSLEFSIDNGTTWTTLAASVPASQLNYSWTVPGTPSNFCSFRVKDVTSSVSDTNDTVFVIPNDLSVQIKYPNGGESFGTGTGQYIEWDYNNIQSLKLEYSLDNGTNWSLIGTVNAADKYANWVAPSAISNQILVRASDVNNALFNDASDLAFSNYALPTTAPEKYLGGSNDGYAMFSAIVVPGTNNPPIIASFLPTSICKLATQYIAITGANLDTVTSVLFTAATGVNLSGTIIAQSATLLQVTVPAETVDGVIRLNSPLGAVDSFTILTVPQVSPRFSQIAAVCSGSVINALPTTSTNGITGTWSPGLNNTATTTYTFTPAIGECATTATMTITVIPNVIYYADNDGDGFGNPAVSQQSCTGAPTGHVTNNTDCNDNTNATTETLISNQPSNATICKVIGAAASFTVVTTVATATYQWYSQAATATTWTEVTNSANYSGATTATLNSIKTTTVVPATGTKYKVVVTSPCGIETSAIVTITDVTALSKAATIAVLSTLSPALTACEGNSVNLSLAAGSIGNIQWQSSTDGISYSNVGALIVQSALSATNAAMPFNTGVLTQATWFRVVATNGVCSSVNGTALKITVSSPVNVGIISGGDLTVCAPLTAGLDSNGNALTAPITNSTTLSLSDYTEGATILWQKSINFNTATPTWVAAGGTTNTFTASILTVDTWYRVLVTNGACSVATAVTKITVNKAAKAGTTTSTTNGIVTTSICQGGAITFTSAAYTGTSIQWEVSTTSSTAGFVPIEGATGISFTMNNVAYAALSKFYVRSVVTSGACTLARSTVKTITVTAGVIPQFTPVATICAGSSLNALPTTSTNGITGTWSPELNNNLTTTYTFTPTAGQCAVTAAMTITVSPGVLPEFTPIAPIRAGTSIVALPTTSLNGYTGTWSPEVNNLATTDYTFTPDAGQCATTATQTIVVNGTPTPTALAQTFCGTSTVANLVATGENIKWYSSAIGGVTLASSTVLAAGTYYASQSIKGNESTRTEVAVSVNDAEITASATTVCSGTGVELNINQQNISGPNYSLYHQAGGYLADSNNDDYVVFPVSPTLNTNYSSWTMECWAKIMSPADEGILSIGNGEHGGGNVLLSGWSNVFGAYSNSNEGVAGAVSNYNYTQGVWNHFALSYQSGTYRLFLNGVLKENWNSGSSVAINDMYPLMTNTHWWWRGGDLSSHRMTVYYDDIRVSKVCRYTADFVPKTNWNNDTNTVGLWNFDEGSGNTVIDYSGNLNNGIIYGATYSSDVPMPSVNKVKTSVTYLWSTGETTATINQIPTATTTYWCDVTVNGLTCRKEMTIEVMPKIIPTFSPVASICAGSVINTLPTTSLNGYTGTWSPALNNFETTEYTFTPAEGQCATTTTQTITITGPKVTSQISFVAPAVTVADLPNVTIGTQVWTSKNLDVSTYRDGTPIPQVTDPTAWANLTTGAWCYYNNDQANGAIYGKLYNWYAVAGIYDNASLSNTALRKQFAPLGWHVPSDIESKTLIIYLDPQADGFNNTNIAGGKMKETETSHWINPNTNATNSSNFRGLPGGMRTSDGSFVSFGISGTWFIYPLTNAYACSFGLRNYDSVAFVYCDISGHKFGKSGRLIKD